jgi:hypothetical protein
MYFQFCHYMYKNMQDEDLINSLIEKWGIVLKKNIKTIRIKVKRT